MTVSRRTIVTMLGGAIIAPAFSAIAKGKTMEEWDGQPLFGLVGQMMAAPGKRAELIQILSEGTGDMPGCVSYVIAEDSKDENVIWITEVWISAEKHKASLQLPVVQAAIAKGRPLIAGFGVHSETKVVAGFGF